MKVDNNGIQRRIINQSVTTDKGVLFFLIKSDHTSGTGAFGDTQEAEHVRPHTKQKLQIGDNRQEILGESTKNKLTPAAPCEKNKIAKTLK